MNGYVFFFNGKRVEIHADSLYAAKLKAVAHLKPRKSQVHMVQDVEEMKAQQINREVNMTRYKMHFCCLNVPEGWQTGVWFSEGVTFAVDAEDTYPIGPVFNRTTDLWAWQKDNLPNQGETPIT